MSRKTAGVIGRVQQGREGVTSFEAKIKLVEANSAAGKRNRADRR